MATPNAEVSIDPRGKTSPLRFGQKYPSPFFDIASLFLPPRIKDLFKYCQLYAMTDEVISSTIYKLAQYPITDINYGTDDTKLKSQWKKILEDDLEIRKKLEEAGLDYTTYGNYIASFYTPFTRYLVCPNCKFEHVAKGIKFIFKQKDFSFYASCKNCSDQTVKKMAVRDVPLKKVSQGMNIVRWNPMHVDIEFNPISGKSQYYYNLPNDFRKRILSGRREVLEETPWSFIVAAKNRLRVHLDPDSIIHISRPSISYGDQGWGIPLIVPLLKARYYYQILLKAREAVLQQHIVPMWMLYPLPQANMDPHAFINMGKWRSEIEMNVNRWKRDPNHIAVFPIPTGFQQIGGDARALSVIDEMRFMQETMIMGLQVPKEFLIGGMSWSGSSVTFRMVENFFLNQIRGLKKLIKFVIAKVHLATGLEEVDIGFTRLKWVDDVQQKSLLVNANANGKISDDTLMRELGHDMAEEFKKMEGELEQQAKINTQKMVDQAEAQGQAQVVAARYQAKSQAEMMKEQRNVSQELIDAGYPPEIVQQMLMSVQNTKPTGGQFAPGGILGKEPNRVSVAGGQPQQQQQQQQQVTDPNMWAEQFAKSMSQVDSSQRGMLLDRLRMENPQLHALVSEKMMQANGVDSRPNPQQKPPRRESSGAAPSRANAAATK